MSVWAIGSWETCVTCIGGEEGERPLEFRSCRKLEEQDTKRETQNKKVDTSECQCGNKTDILVTGRCPVRQRFI